MNADVKIPVSADTSKARADLKQLHRDKQRAKKRVASASKRTSRIITRALAFTGTAASFGKFQNDESSGKADMFGEALAPYAAMTQQHVDEKLGVSGRAQRSARERTKAAFRYHVGRTGETAGMTDFFNAVSRIQNDIESGRNLIRQDPRFIGPDLVGVTKAAIVGNLDLFFKNIQALNPTDMISRGFDYMIEGIMAE